MTGNPTLIAHAIRQKIAAQATITLRTKIVNAFHTGLAVKMTFSQQICFVNAIQPKFAAMETHGPPIHYAITALAPKLAA